MRRLVRLSAAAALAVFASLGQVPAPLPTTAAAHTLSAPAPVMTAHPGQWWSPTQSSLQLLLDELPGSDGVSVRIGDTSTVSTGTGEAEAAVMAGEPDVIVIAPSVLEEYGPGPESRFRLQALIAHELTHSLLFSAGVTAGDFPSELAIDPAADAHWAPGAIEVGYQRASHEAVGACVQASAFVVAGIPLPEDGFGYITGTGCDRAYTEAAFAFIEQVSGVDLRVGRLE